MLKEDVLERENPLMGNLTSHCEVKITVGASVVTFLLDVCPTWTRGVA
jgi:hypothetical protein